MPNEQAFTMLDSSAVDHKFESPSGQINDCKIGICCFVAKHAVLMSKRLIGSESG
jgi:hypothetical protein